MERTLEILDNGLGPGALDFLAKSFDFLFL